MKVTGTVRGSGATKVMLYQLSGTRWVAWHSAALVAGRYTIYYKPVSTDGIQKWARTMTLGQSQAVSLSVRGVMRLRLGDTIVEAAPSGGEMGPAFGNARVLCRF